MIKEETNLKLINKFLKIYNNSMIEKIDNPFLKYIFIYSNNEPIGFMSFNLLYERIEIENIFILELERGKGYASKLMDYLIDIALLNKTINITLEVRIDNITAINLYKKYAFEIGSIRKNYYGNIDGYLMIRMM